MTNDPADNPTDTAPSAEAADAARCHWCGYPLRGLGESGDCPECGTAYTVDSSLQLQPWPSPGRICMRLGWPIIGLLLAGFILVGSQGSDNPSWVMGMIIGYAMIVAVGLNSYVQVRSMLRRSLPEGIRTRGPVAIWRKIGTTICVIILLVFVGGPFLFGVGCLILLSGMN